MDYEEDTFIYVFANRAGRVDSLEKYTTWEANRNGNTTCRSTSDMVLDAVGIDDPLVAAKETTRLWRKKHQRLWTFPRQ